MNQATALLGLVTETSLHAGAGASIGAVDLPIQREGHNGWPCVFGSAVKGSLRDRAENVPGPASDEVLAVFGPDTKNASDNAGALSVGDARLLLLPVRSMTTSFRWVTCPEALRRLSRDAERLGVANLDITAPDDVRENDARVAGGTGGLFLEEYRFEMKPDQAPDTTVASVAEKLAGLMTRDGAQQELKQRLVVIADDMFSHLVQAAIPVAAHIALDSTTKTVVGGALWYEETLPPETVLYVPLLATDSRKENKPMARKLVLKAVSDLFSSKAWLQLGGNETVGMGWCAVRMIAGQE